MFCRPKLYTKFRPEGNKELILAGGASQARICSVILTQVKSKIPEPLCLSKWLRKQICVATAESGASRQSEKRRGRS